MSYGTVSGVAALSAQWTDSGVFTSSTKPTVSQVTQWLEDVSTSLDIALSDFGFSTPITATAILPSLNLLVQGIVKELVDYSHGAGRFYVKKALEGGISPFMIIDKELHEWVERKAIGLRAKGAGVDDDTIGRKVATFDLF